MSESSARETFKKHVKEADPSHHLQRFEDRFHSGIPDINICFSEAGEWWVEAKHISSLPKRVQTLVRVPLRIEQVLWLNARKKSGGRCLVILRIGLDEWVAFKDHFDELEKGVSQERFRKLACWQGKKLDVSEIFNLPQRCLKF